MPELPGCVSQGATLEELERNIREAIEAVIEDYFADDRALPYESAVQKWQIPVRVERPAELEARA